MQFKGVDLLEQARFAVMCLDRENNMHACSLEDETRIVKRRRWTTPHETEWFFDKFYGRGRAAMT
jgi:hypothetical protein